MTGNDKWWDCVYSYKDAMDIPTYKEAESKCFHILYKRMQEDQMKQEEIREFFLTTYGLKYGAFYARVRRIYE